MNHILHSGKDTVPPDDRAHFGINAMEKLFDEMITLGAVRSYLVAKVFGGGKILDFTEKYHVGDRNSDFVMDFLKTYKVRVLAQNTGGHFSCKLFFHTDTCEALLKKFDVKSYLKSEKEINRKLSSRVKSVPQKEGRMILF